MGTRLIIGGTDEVGYFSADPVGGLADLFFFDTNLDKATKNFIKGRWGLSPQGTFSFGATDPLTLKNRVSTLLTAEPAGQYATVFVVIKKPENNKACALMEAAAGTPTGMSNAVSDFSVGLADDNYLSFSVSISGDGVTAALVRPNLYAFESLNWTLFRFGVGPGVISFTDLTANQSRSVAYTGTRAMVPTPLHIGWSRFSAIVGSIQVASYWRYPRYLSDAEVAQAALMIRAREARHGRIV